MAFTAAERMRQSRDRRRTAEGRERAVRKRQDEGADMLRVSCWCEATFVGVPADDVRNGITGSCNSVLCKP